MRNYMIAGAALATLLTAVGGAAYAQRFFGGYPYKTGEEVYTHVCQGCHMPDAKGATGSAIYGYPALANNPKLSEALYPAMVIVSGQKAMPAFDSLSDEQVAGVVNYIRTHFGNNYTEAMTPAQVKEIRPAPETSEGRRPG